MDELHKYLIHVVDVHHEAYCDIFNSFSTELFLEGIIAPPRQVDLIEILSRTKDTLENSQLYDTIITFEPNPKLMQLANANKNLVYNCIVWLYVLDSLVIVLEHDDHLKDLLVDKWNRKTMVKTPSLGHLSASKYFKLFKNDYDLCSLTIQMNLIEMTMCNFMKASLNNVYDGCYLLKNSMSASPQWIHTYWMLSLAFACNETHDLSIVCALLFPALVETSGKDWMERRLLSIKMVDALTFDLHEMSNSNYWDLDDVGAHLQTHLKLTSLKLMKSTNLVSL
jgi:hypothetical protein